MSRECADLGQRQPIPWLRQLCPLATLIPALQPDGYCLAPHRGS